MDVVNNTKCFLCPIFFCDVKSYINHLKIKHKCKNLLSNFMCTNCPQSFQSIYSFKRHINKHLLTNLSKLYPDNSNIYNSGSANSSSILNVKEHQRASNICNNTSTTDFDSYTHSPFADVPNTFISADSASDEVDSKLQNKITDFFLDLLGTMSLPRKVVFDVANKMYHLIIVPLFQAVKNELKTVYNDRIDNMFLDVQKQFEVFKSDYKLKQYLINTDLYSEPIEYSINNSSNINILSTVSKGIIFPIKDNIRRYLELPGIFTMMHNYLEVINKSDDYINVCSGSVWKKKTQAFSSGELILPYILYQDDFEINNPLGSKSGVQKLSAMYLTFPLLSKQYASKLCNILIACLTKTVALQFGLEANFGTLCLVLKELEEDGIEITIDSKQIRVHLILAALIGDNLALNTMLGYTRSFTANYFCRICKCHKDVMRTQVVEDTNTMRSRANYWQDIFTNDCSITGIRESCIFEKLSTFDTVDNISVDIMHDLLEGICHNELIQYLSDFVYKKKYFTLDILNNRKKNFQYHHSDNNSLSVEITAKCLKSAKLKMSASEMLCFMHYLPIIIGDLVPDNDDVWKCLLLLAKLVHMCLLPSYNNSQLEELQSLIKEHHELYLELFKTYLIPKHHHIIHYPTVITKLGPLKQLWVMRQEAKHKQTKSYLHVISSRKHVLLTSAIKWQYNLASYLYSFRNCSEVPYKSENLNLASECEKVNTTELPFSRSLLNNVLSCHQIKINNIKYRQNDVIIIKHCNSAHGLQFHYVRYIIVVDNIYYIVTSVVRIRRFDDHILSFLVEQPQSFVTNILNISCCIYPPTNIISLRNNCLCVKLKPPFE